MAEEQNPSIQITSLEAAPIIAMEKEQQEIMRQANKRLKELREAVQFLGGLYAKEHQLPVREGAVFLFNIDDGKTYLTLQDPVQEEEG